MPRSPDAPGRGDILSAATREFADHGYAGATTAGIARRAGVTQPLVHHHFGSKRGLWNAVLEKLFQDLNETLSKVVAETSSSTRAIRLEKLLRAFVIFGGQRPELGRLIRTESSAGGDAFNELYDHWLLPWIHFYEAELNAAIGEGVARTLDARLAYFAIIGASGTAFAEPVTARRAFKLDMTRPELIERYADLVVDLVLHGVLLPTTDSPDKAR